MSFGFNADEILRIAERIERNGALFYRAAAELSESPELRDEFLELAEMEVAHEKTFAALHAELAPEETKATAFDPGNETHAYLSAMADAAIFDESQDPKDLARTAGTPTEILRIAIGLEKDSILFYLGLKDMISERHGRERVLSIIDEEKSHVALLQGKLAGTH